MAYLLRFATWDEGVSPIEAISGQQSSLQWLTIPSDYLVGIGAPVDNGSLSVYRVERPDDPIIERIIAAFVATRPPPRAFEALTYVLIEESVLVSAGFVTNDELGETLDVDVNKCHRNLIDISILRLLLLFHLTMHIAEHEPLSSKKLMTSLSKWWDTLEWNRFDEYKNSKNPNEKKLYDQTQTKKKSLWEKLQKNNPTN